MMPTIRIDDDVFAGLKQLAEPFVDTPNTVIRRMLAAQKVANQLLTAPTESVSQAPQAAGPKLTPQKVYEPFLLKVLAQDFAGKASKAEVTAAVIKKMADSSLLSAVDYERVSTGETKAENMIAWARNALKDRGLIRSGSQRGCWELTPQGMAQAQATPPHPT